MTFAERIEDAWWNVREFAVKAWLVVRHRPFFTCPLCKGKGGAMQGYYEPEWSECSACYERWESLDDHGWTWFVGRLPLLDYLRCRASIRCGMWELTRFRDLIRCKLGIHRWHDDEAVGKPICCVCYEVKGEKRELL